MKYKKTKLFIFLGIFLVGIVIVSFAIKQYAQNVNPGLVLYPSNFDLAYVNKPLTQNITLLNNTDKQITIRVEVRNFTSVGEEGGAALTTEDTNYSLAKWITVTPTSTIIPAKTSHVFSFTIIPPKNAEPGGHFGSIVFTSVPNSNISGTAGAAVAQEVASLILLRMPGNATEQAMVETLTTDKNFYEFGPVNFDLRVRNTGNIHIIPAGSLVVQGTFGDRHLVDISPRVVLPDSIRKIPAVLTDKFLLGQYTAKLVSTYGTQNKQLYASVVFYAFPVRYALVVLVVIVLLFLMRKRFFKAFKALATGK